MNRVGRRLILVPETYLNCKSDKKEVLNTIKHPIENAVYESAVNMKRILADNNLSEEEKVKKHVHELNNYTVLTDKMKGSNDLKQNDSVTIIDEIPKTLRQHANNFLKRLKNSAIDWNDNGEVSVNGKVWRGSNITDLVGSVLRNRKGFNPAYQDEFLQSLAAVNIPDEYVRNKTILSRYRLYKKAPPGIYLSDEEAISPVKNKKKTLKRLKKTKWLSVK